ncbi:hypothetical protein U0070_009388 [Myodes glareolus]|uniref:Uncharacterized protein n=1 Tax=Myodes glareolus TaxID=447135 RepID=A0AAW0HV53_MYOGA
MERCVRVVMQQLKSRVLSMKRSSVSTGGAGRLSLQELRSQDLDKPGLYTPQT